MTYKQIQDAVLLNTFDESQRTSVKDWINTRYTWLCDLADWSFMRAVANVTVTNGTTAVSGVPADLGVANALVDQYGARLEKITNPEVFVHRYLGIPIFTGQPEAFTVFGSPATFDGGQFGDGDFGGGEGLIAVGPTSNVTSAAFKLLYERAVPTLVADADVPILPAGYHMGLAVGARALGCRMNGMTAEAGDMDGEFRGTIDSMRAKYLRPVRDRTGQSPAYRPC